MKLDVSNALIAIATGSNEIDVIVSSCVLRKCGFKVTIASADGWSGVTLRNGLTIKPDCSLTRALSLHDNSVPFDLILLPDGDTASVARLAQNEVFSGFIKRLFSHPAYSQKPLKFADESRLLVTSNKHDCYVIVAGLSCDLFKIWKILPNRMGLLTWFIKNLSSDTIYFTEDKFYSNVGLVFCSSTSRNDIGNTVHACKQVAFKIFKSKGLNYNFEMENSDDKFAFMKHTNNHFWMHFIGFFSTLQLFSTSWKSYFAIIENAIQRGLVSRSNFNKGYGISTNSRHILWKSFVHVFDRLKEFGYSLFRLGQSRILHTHVGILIQTGIDEGLLAIMATTLKMNGVLTHLIACDRSIMKTTEPYVSTKNFLQVRADGFIEVSKFKYDVIITMDSDVKIQKNSDFFSNDTPANNASCVTAFFDKVGLRLALQALPLRLLPIFNKKYIEEKCVCQPITAEVLSSDKESKCFQVLWDEKRQNSCHNLLVDLFRVFHDNNSILHVVVTTLQDADHVARFMLDRLKYEYGIRGYIQQSLARESHCNLL